MADRDKPSRETLGDDELQALLERLRTYSDVRGEGAVTVEDVAEGSGMPAHQVAEHLRQLRAERAFDVQTRRRPIAIARWTAFAMVGVAVAAGAWILAAPSWLERDAAETLLPANKRPAHTGMLKLDPAVASAPHFLAYKLDDNREGLEVPHTLNEAPISRSEAVATSVRCLTALAEAAANDVRFNKRQSPFLNLTVTVGGTTQSDPAFPIRPSPGESEAEFLRDRERVIRATAENIVSLECNRIKELIEDVKPTAYAPYAPPPGYSVSLHTDPPVEAVGPRICIYPVNDHALQEHLSLYISTTLQRFQERGSDYPQASGKPRPMTLTPIVHVVIEGPLRKDEADLPAAPEERQGELDTLCARAAGQMAGMNSRIGP